MNLGAIMDAVADGLTGAGVVSRAYAYPKESVDPPAAVVGYPAEIDYDAAMRDGTHRITVPVWLVIGKVVDRTTRDRVSALVDQDEVKAALDGDLDGTVQSCRVTAATIEAVAVAGVEYLGIRFDLDIYTS